MINYLIIFSLSVVLLAASYLFSERELLAPAPLFFLGITTSIALAIVGIGSWNSYLLSAEVCLIVVIGMVFSCLGGLAAHKLIQIKKSDNITCKKIERAPRLWKYAIVGALILIAIFLRVSETYKIGAAMGLHDLEYSIVSARVREATESFINAQSLKLDFGFSFIERQFEKIVWATGFVSTFLLARAISNRSKKEVLPPALLLILTWGFYILAGGRGTIMYQIISFFTVLTILLYHRKGADKKKINRRIIFFGAASALLCIGFMYFASALVGRPANSGLLSYVSFYFGGSIPSLQILLDSGNLPTSFIGSNTFYYLFAPLFKFGLIDSFPNYSLSWVDAGGNNSNIFTCFARYYIDFNFLGVAILSFAAMAFLVLFYRWAISSNNSILIMLVGYFSPFIFDAAREEFVFSRLFSLSQVFTLIVIVSIAIFLLTDFKEAKSRCSLIRGKAKRI